MSNWWEPQSDTTPADAVSTTPGVAPSQQPPSSLGALSTAMGNYRQAVNTQPVLEDDKAVADRIAAQYAAPLAPVATPPAQNGSLWDSTKSALGELGTAIKRVPSEFQSTLGGAMAFGPEGSGIATTGKEWQKSAEQTLSQPEYQLHPEEHGFLTNTLAKGIGLGGQILPTAAVGLAAAPLLPQTALGTAAAYGLGSLLPAALFGAAQGQSTRERVAAVPGNSAEDARTAGLLTAAGSTAAGLLGGRLAGEVASPFLSKVAPELGKDAAAALSRATTPQSVTGYLGGLAQHGAETAAGFAGMGAANRAVEQEYGVEGPSIMDAALNSLQDAAGLSLVSAPFGAAGVMRNNAAVRKTADALSSPDTAPEARSAIALKIAQGIKEVDPKAGLQFLNNAQDAIQAKRPLTLGEALLNPTPFDPDSANGDTLRRVFADPKAVDPTIARSTLAGMADPDRIGNLSDAELAQARDWASGLANHPDLIKDAPKEAQALADAGQQYHEELGIRATSQKIGDSLAKAPQIADELATHIIESANGNPKENVTPDYARASLDNDALAARIQAGTALLRDHSDTLTDAQKAALPDALAALQSERDDRDAASNPDWRARNAAIVARDDPTPLGALKLFEKAKDPTAAVNQLPAEAVASLIPRLEAQSDAHTALNLDVPDTLSKTLEALRARQQKILEAQGQTAPVKKVKVAPGDDPYADLVRQQDTQRETLKQQQANAEQQRAPIPLIDNELPTPLPGNQSVPVSEPTPAPDLTRANLSAPIGQLGGLNRLGFAGALPSPDAEPPRSLSSVPPSSPEEAARLANQEAARQALVAGDTARTAGQLPAPPDLLAAPSSLPTAPSPLPRPELPQERSASTTGAAATSARLVPEAVPLVTDAAGSVPSSSPVVEKNPESIPPLDVLQNNPNAAADRLLSQSPPTAPTPTESANPPQPEISHDPSRQGQAEAEALLKQDTPPAGNEAGNSLEPSLQPTSDSEAQETPTGNRPTVQTTGNETLQGEGRGELGGTGGLHRTGEVRQDQVSRPGEEGQVTGKVPLTPQESYGLRRDAARQLDAWEGDDGVARRAIEQEMQEQGHGDEAIAARLTDELAKREADEKAATAAWAADRDSRPSTPAVRTEWDTLPVADRESIEKVAQEARRKLLDIPEADRRKAIGFARTGLPAMKKNVTAFLADYNTLKGQLVFDSDIASVIKHFKSAQAVVRYEKAHQPIPNKPADLSSAQSESSPTRTPTLDPSKTEGKNSAPDRVSEEELDQRGTLIRSFVDKVHSSPDKQPSLNLGEIGNDAANIINEKTHLSVNGSVEIIISDSVVHSTKNHPDITNEDWGKLPRLTNQFDDVALGRPDKNVALSRIIMRKTFPDGTGYGAVLSFANGRSGKRLNLVTYFKGRGKSLDAWWNQNKQGLDLSSVPNRTEPWSEPPQESSKPADSLAQNNAGETTPAEAPKATEATPEVVSYRTADGETVWVRPQDLANPDHNVIETYNEYGQPLDDFISRDELVTQGIGKARADLPAEDLTFQPLQRLSERAWVSFGKTSPEVADTLNEATDRGLVLARERKGRTEYKIANADGWEELLAEKQNEAADTNDYTSPHYPFARDLKYYVDSPDQLRSVDAYRILDEAAREDGDGYRQAMAKYLKKVRPDLADKIDGLLADLAAENEDVVSSDDLDAAMEAALKKKAAAEGATSTEPPLLSSYSKADLDARNAATEKARADQVAADKAADDKEAADKAADDKEAADRARNDFVLSGSDRPANIAASRGQEDLLAGAKSNERPEDYGANNKLVSTERANVLREKLRAKLGQLNSGIDPEMLAMGTELAVYHLEAGARKFADFTHSMINDLGEAARPYLRSWYEGGRHFPDVDAKDMTPAADIDAAAKAAPVEYDMFGEPIPTSHAAIELPVVNVPVSDLKLSQDVPQFKSGTNNKTGVVEPLGGTFDPTGVAPIQVWRRLNGDLEVISGRHRLDLAQRSSRKTIAAQIHNEADRFNAKQAGILDAELNIRDGQGKVKDYVDYFTRSGISKEEADLRGLISRHIGKSAFTIANDGTAELIAAHRADVISDEAAVSLARTAPGDARLQAVGLKAVQDGQSIINAVNLMQAVKALASGRSDTTGDLFGLDDSAMKEAAAMAKVASRNQRQLSERLAAIQGATKRPELARKEGVDVKDPQALLAKIAELKQEREAWESWSTHPGLIGKIREELNPKKEEPPIAKETAPEPTAPSTTPEPALFKEDIAGFVSSKKSKQQDRAAKALNAPTPGLGTMTREAAIRNALDSGAVIVHGKDGKRTLSSPDGGLTFTEAQLSATGLDYAEHLLKQREAGKGAATPEGKGEPDPFAHLSPLRQARHKGEINTPTYLARLAEQVVKGEIPIGKLYGDLQPFNDWSEGEVADALRKAGASADFLKGLGYEAAKGKGESLPPNVSPEVVARLEQTVADAKENAQEEQRHFDNIQRGDNIPSSAQAGGSNYRLGNQRAAMNDRQQAAFARLTAANEALQGAERRLAGYRSGEYHENGQPRADAPSRVAQKSLVEQYADFIRATMKVGDEIQFAGRTAIITRFNPKTVTLDGRATWGYDEIHPMIEGRPATKPEIMAAFKAWQEQQAAKGEAAPKEPWQMTSAEYAQDVLDRSEYREEYEANPEDKAQFLKNQLNPWTQAVEKAAETNIIPNNVLDDFADRFGVEATLRAFRGVNEKGRSQWQPKNIREQGVDSTPTAPEGKGDQKFAASPSTPSILTDNLKALAGDKTVQDLIDNDRLKLVARQSDLPAHAEIPDGKRVAGWVDPKTGQVYLVAENIHPDEVQGLNLHEISVHQEQLGLNQPKSQGLKLAHAIVKLVGGEQILGKNDFQDVLSQLQRMRELGNTRVLEAYAKAQAAAEALGQSPHLIHEEALAYLVQHFPKLPLVQRVIASVRAFLYKAGFKMNLTDNDLHALAVSALKDAAARQDAMRNPARLHDDPVLAAIADIRYAQHLGETEPNLSPEELMKHIEAGGEITAEEWQRFQQFQSSYLRAAAQPASSGNTLKAWFGESKIKNKAGEPVKMYHGTSADFEAFDPNKAGGSTTHPTAALGFFFTNNRSHAAEKYAGDGGKVLETYLSIEKPYTMTDADLRRIDGPEDAVAFRKKLEAQGYDGIVMPQEVAGTRYVAAFYPDQIKLTSNETFTKGDNRIRYAEAGEKAKDAAYLDAVARGDKETAQKMVDAAAEAAGAQTFDAPDVTAFSVRRTAPPRQTQKAYKAFRMVDGKLRPLYVGAVNDIPIGVWLDAKDGGFRFRGPDKVDKKTGERTPGAWYVTGDTGTPTRMDSLPAESQALLRENGINKQWVSLLAYRPGWHTGTLPFNPQGAGAKDPLFKSGHPTADHPYAHILYPDIVIAEVELAADKNYQKEFEATAVRTKKGGIKTNESGLRNIPTDGFYNYTTNANNNDLPGDWLIGGSLKVNRLLTQQEANQILLDHGAFVQKRVGGDLNLDALRYDPSQRHEYYKLRDPVTYDDEGNVIPLSQRFNPKKSDQRYALASAATAPPANPVQAKSIGERLADAVPETVRNFAATLGKEFQSYATPMALGDSAEAGTARALAKDYMNAQRTANYEAVSTARRLTATYTPAQLKQMWEGLDASSTAALTLEAGGMSRADAMKQVERQRIGAFALPAEMKNEVLAFSARADANWQNAQRVGLVAPTAKGLPFWTPRTAALIGEDGTFGKVGSSGSGGNSHPLDMKGVNFTTSSPNLKQRKYLDAKDTEAAMQAKFGADAGLIRDIRTMPLAMARLEQAIAARDLINQIKVISAATGAVEHFELDHPAFKTWQPRLVQDAATGKWKAVIDKNGDTVFDKVPIKVSSEFEGPLRAVLGTKPSAWYTGLMKLKLAALGLIMYSPMIHNMVIWGKALPALPGKVATGRIYFEGNAIKNDPAAMKEWVQNGLVPINQTTFHPDIPTALTNLSGHETGLLATGISKAVGLVNKGAGEQVARTLSAIGNFWHNTLLWDRVADLQVGMADNFRKELMAGSATQPPLDRQTATRIAAHFANRFAGALPKEAMGEAATRLANLSLFSRSFTIGNLSIMKDMMTGLPKDVQAQILRDAGEGTQNTAVSRGKKMAMHALLLDVGMLYAMNMLIQGALDHWKHGKSLSAIEQGYVRRFGEAMKATSENPLNILGLGSYLDPTHDNEQGKENRFFAGRDPQTGTASYVRLPTGKVAEELVGWGTQPLAMLRKKTSTLVKPVQEVFANRDWAGKPIYDADTPGIDGMIKSTGQVVQHLMESQAPVESAVSAWRLLAGKGRPEDPLKTIGPLLGVTFSNGYPGGPELGEMAAANRRHEAVIQEIRPAVKERIKDHDVQGAIDQMVKAGMTPSQMRALIISVVAPQTRLNSAHLEHFARIATPEERQKLAVVSQLGRAAAGP